MSSEVTVTLGGESRVVPVGTIVRDVLKNVPSKDLVAARIDGKVVDLTRKLDHDASVEPVLAESPEGLDVIRHSTAHLMAMALQSPPRKRSRSISGSSNSPASATIASSAARWASTFSIRSRRDRRSICPK